MRKVKLEYNIIIIFIMYDLFEVMEVDYVIVMNKGIVYKEGIVIEIFDYVEELIIIGLDLLFLIKIN